METVCRIIKLWLLHEVTCQMLLKSFSDCPCAQEKEEERLHWTTRNQEKRLILSNLHYALWNTRSRSTRSVLSNTILQTYVHFSVFIHVISVLDL
jgi:hypothetical protein